MPWSEPGLLAAGAAGALGISAGGTAWAIAYARRRGMLDQPGERRSHATATPRGGGIGTVQSTAKFSSGLTVPHSLQLGHCQWCVLAPKPQRVQR